MSLQDTVASIREDFVSISRIPREELLAMCTQSRLEEINIKYEYEFDKLLMSLQESCLDEHDFTKLSESLNTLSSVLSTLCATLLNHIKFYSSND